MLRTLLRSAPSRSRSVVTRTLAPSSTFRRFSSPADDDESLRDDLERFGVDSPPDAYEKYADPYSKHRAVVPFPHKGAWFWPRISREAFVAPCATVIGNVELWDHASLWYGVVVKADTRLIRIGAYTNVQDRSVIGEALEPLSDEHDGSTIIGNNVTIGHRVRIRAATIEDNCLVGMGSTLEDASHMEKNSLLGAGSVLVSGSRVRSGELWAGNPAKKLRDLTPAELQTIARSAEEYRLLALRHREEFYLSSTAYLEAEALGIPVGYTDHHG